MSILAKRGSKVGRVAPNAPWRETALGEILPLKYGKARSTEYGYSRAGTSTFGSSGAFGPFDRALTETPALIVGRKGAAGSVHYSAEPCWPIDTAFYTEGTERTFLPFFRYLLESLQLVRLDRSTAIPSLSRDDYDAKIVRYPEDLKKQRRIVAEIEKQFTRLDAGIAALRRTQANLKRYRAAVLKAACEGRLVPTEADLAKQQSPKRGLIPRKSGTSDFESGALLLERILTERRKIHEQEQKRATRKKKYKEPNAPTTPSDEKLPAGWTWATWDQIGDSQNGRPFPSADYQETGFNLLRPGNLHVSGKVIWTENNTRCLPQRFADENPDLVVGGGEVVMNLTAQSLKDEFLGRVCVTGDGDQCLLNQRLARLTPVVVSPQFVLVLLKAWRFRRFVDGLNSGSLIQHMFTSQLAEFTFALPPLAEQTRIVAEVERRLSVVEELEAVVSTNLQRATRLRQAILRQAFSGGLVKAEIGAAPIFTVQLSPQSKRRRHFLRVLLSAEIVHQLHAEPTFGQIKHQKVFHLCEHVARLSELDVQYHRDAAGPFDNQLIYANEGDLKRNKWYVRVGHHYRPMKKAGGHAKYLVEFSQDQLATIHRLIELMRRWDTKTCEIFSTAYAAWNDLIILQREPTDAAILNEILNRWHPSKRDIPEKRWRDAIAWMKKEDFAPTGFGRPTTKSG